MPSDNQRDSFGVRKSIAQDAHILHVTGDIDLSVAEKFKAALEEAVATACSPLIVDLSEVVYMDSTGFRWLMHARTLMNQRGDTFKIVVPSPLLRRLFSILQLDTIVEVYGTLEDAIAPAT
jgi:anti-sigma B factor antagonist